MRQTVLLLAVLLLLLTVPTLGAEDSQTLKGSFAWSRGSEGDLEAVFTPTGTDEWDVSFYFEFRGNHVYSGTAQGSLTQGELKGTVQNEDKRRTFTFSGRITDDKFKGTHAETTGGSSKTTGTMTLSR